MSLDSRFCPNRSCDSKLIKKPKGHNIFGEVSFDMVCPRCHMIVVSWEEICADKERKNERVVIKN